MSIEKDKYRSARITELGKHYRSHSTSKTDWDHRINAEIGNFPEFSEGSSAKLVFELLLACNYSVAQIVQILEEKFPGRSNARRPNRILNIFSNGKCRNMTVYKQGEVLGLKWDRYKFFSKDGSPVRDELIEFQVFHSAFEQSVNDSIHDTPSARKARLKVANRYPTQKFAVVKVYERNPDVVAEVLNRANGICENCGANAPFNRLKDGSPYLEVHHIIQLALDGPDTVDNAIGLCPNCHRQAHYGILELKSR